MFQTVPVGLRYKLVAVPKTEERLAASIYMSTSTASAYPQQSYDMKLISVTNHQLGKLIFR